MPRASQDMETIVIGLVLLFGELHRYSSKAGQPKTLIVSRRVTPI